MKTRVNSDRYKLRQELLCLAIASFIAVVLMVFQNYPGAVERYYSRLFYPYFSYLPKIAFAWLPFSLGDLFYVVVFCVLLYFVGQFLVSLIKRRFRNALYTFLRLLTISISLYAYFYSSWGMNYYRIPLAVQMDLQTDSISKADYVQVLEKYIDRTNSLRELIDTEYLDKKQARIELSQFMLETDDLDGFLSKTQSKGKAPLSNSLVSYFTVTGYFNPFTQEVQVNQNPPAVSYPFTVVHELAHQMGVGFEDECNFIAFLKLKEHSDPWYRYAASYETMQYLLRPLYYQDQDSYKIFVDRIAEQVKTDMNAEREFWQPYTGWFNTLTSIFYSGYLKHNNQPEGMQRYSMMSRLVVAWEMKQVGKAN